MLNIKLLKNRMNVRSLSSVGSSGISSLCILVLGSGVHNEQTQTLPSPPCEILPVLDFSNDPFIAFISPQICLFSTHSALLEYTRSSPGQRDSIVQQTFTVHQSAMATAAGARGTRVDQMKCLPRGAQS